MRIRNEDSIQDCINEESDNMTEIGCILTSPADNTNAIHFGIPDVYSVADLPEYLKFRRYEGDYITGVCRISLLEPRYIKDNNENFRLSESERAKFISILNRIIPFNEAPISDTDKRVAVTMTNWEWILESLDRRLFFLKDKPRYYENLDRYTMPRYEELPL